MSKHIVESWTKIDKAKWRKEKKAKIIKYLTKVIIYLKIYDFYI